MPVHDSVSATIVINRKDAQEYRCYANDANAIVGPKICTAYIEAKSEAEFYFEVRLDASFEWKNINIVTVEAEFDGRYATNSSVERADRERDGSWMMKLDGVIKGNGEDIKHLKWVFDNFDIRAERANEDKSEWEEKFGKLGVLTLNVRRATTNHDPVPGSKVQKPTVQGLVPEGALRDKSVDLATSYKILPVPENVRAPEYISISLRDKKPMVQFNFLYRTRRALQDLGIIENTPDPTPLAKKDPETMTKEELIESVRRSRAVDNLKQERKKSRRGQSGQSASHVGEAFNADSADSSSDDDSDDLQIIEPPVKKQKKNEDPPRAGKSKLKKKSKLGNDKPKSKKPNMKLPNWSGN